MLVLRARPGEVRIMDAYVLLQLLESVVRSRSQGIEPGSVHVASGNVAVGQQRV